MTEAESSLKCSLFRKAASRRYQELCRFAHSSTWPNLDKLLELTLAATEARTKYDTAKLEHEAAFPFVESAAPPDATPADYRRVDPMGRIGR